MKMTKEDVLKEFQELMNEIGQLTDKRPTVEISQKMEKVMTGLLAYPEIASHFSGMVPKFLNDLTQP